MGLNYSQFEVRADKEEVKRVEVVATQKSLLRSLALHRNSSTDAQNCCRSFYLTPAQLLRFKAHKSSSPARPTNFYSPNIIRYEIRIPPKQQTAKIPLSLKIIYVFQFRVSPEIICLFFQFSFCIQYVVLPN